MASSLLKHKVYRLRGCPIYLDRAGIAQLISREFGDISPTDIIIQSLATNPDPWANPRTKVGTLVFRKLPTFIEGQNGNTEWMLDIPGLEKAVVLDIHFMGMTTLNDVEQGKHEFDCIAIAGLASHPFGSWQPKGRNKSFMWLRDELPRAMPKTRISIYGYDTTLVGSNSFQSIQDLALSLINHIKSSGWALPSAKPLIFLAHSLGGIVIKEAFTILADSHERNAHILRLSKGGIFFGVPSQGMSTEHLFAIVKDQVNKDMICDLAESSDYLRALDDQFSGLSLVRNMQFHWAYETKTSPTVIQRANGSFVREGVEEILVSKESATHSRYGTTPTHVFPINANHSDMVKFGIDDPNFRVVIDRLRELYMGENHGIETITKASDPNSTVPNDRAKGRTIQRLMDSLKFPGQDHRFSAVDSNYQHTFKWVYDPIRSPFTAWLKDDQELFWIHGKPGSGKSTLMKFIDENRRTWEHLYDFSTGAISIRVKFFFHDRGNLLQKSFEGLLRSILHQIIEQTQRSKTGVKEFENWLLDHFLPQERQEVFWTLHALERCLRYLIQQNILDLKIFLLLDALDEYDGQPEFICRFLQSLITMASNSRTRLKILFSSRPWDEFRREFGHTPSIQLQDYTRDDIENYCLGTVNSTGGELSTILAPIVSKVIDRANGVFLWVKLALHELIAEATQRRNPNELANALDAIPSDLQEYYTRTLRRIPETLCWDAFVIFEALSKTTGVRGPSSEIVGILECSRHSTYHGCCEALRSMYRSEDPYQRFNELNRRILTSTGNLAEIIIHERNGTGILRSTVQFIHQTVKDFVHSRDFTQTISAILGPRDRRSGVNGHTFMAKYFLALGNPHYARVYLRDHESTTGCSLKRFIDGIPKDFYHSHRSKYDSGNVDVGVRGPLGFALHNNLQLYLEERLRCDPDVFRNTKENLFDVIPIDPSWQRKHLTLFRFIMENGYFVQQDQRIFASINNDLYVDYPKLHLLDFVDEKSTILAAKWELDMWFPIGPRSSSLFFYRKRLQLVNALHQAKRPNLTRYILDRGGKVNGPDSLGNTPLDHAVKFWFEHKDEIASAWAPVIYETIEVLIEYGGVFVKSSFWRRKAFVKSLNKFGRESGLGSRRYSLRNAQVVRVIGGWTADDEG